MTKRTKKLLIILYVVIILAFSIAMISNKIALDKRWVLHVRLDHLSHVILFIPWMVLADCFWQKKKGAVFFFLAFAAGWLLAMVSEGLQYFVHYRSFDVTDLLTNWLGVFIGGMIMWVIRHGRKMGISHLRM